jgi:hypothetical protein
MDSEKITEELLRTSVRLEAHEQSCDKNFHQQDRQNTRVLELISEGRDTARKIYEEISDMRAGETGLHAKEGAMTEKKLTTLSNEVHKRIDTIEGDRLTRERSTFEDALANKQKELDEFKSAAAMRLRNAISVAGLLFSLAVALGLVGTLG